MELTEGSAEIFVCSLPWETLYETDQSNRPIRIPLSRCAKRFADQTGGRDDAYVGASTTVCVGWIEFAMTSSRSQPVMRVSPARKHAVGDIGRHAACPASSASVAPSSSPVHDVVDQQDSPCPERRRSRSSLPIARPLATLVDDGCASMRL